MKPVQTIPQAIVEIDGAVVARSLAEVRVRQRLNLPTQCELVFIEPEEEPIGRPGSTLRVSLPDGKVPLFCGEVTAVEYEYGPSRSRIVRLRGYDVLHRLRKRQPVRAHVQVTAADLARELTADLGISVDASESGPMNSRLIQFDQTDFDLLSEVLGRSGLYFIVRDEALQILTLQGIGSPVALKLGDSLLEARIDVNVDASCCEVEAQGWDPERAESHQGRATAPRSVLSDCKRMRVGGAIQTDPQAEALAQAELDAGVAREVTLWGVAAGDPELRPGTPVEIDGLSPALERRYVLASVDHTIDARQGYVSELSSVPPPRVVSPRTSATALGIVTRVDDPEKLGRLQAQLPAVAGVETGWMEVVMPGAGPDKGFIALPDVGDRVLILFLQGDPTQGVVLGGMHGVDGPPDSGVVGGAVKRFLWATPGGQRVLLDDENETLRLENSPGNYLELSPKKVVLHSAVDLTLEAPGRSIAIRGGKVDFQKA